MSQYDDWLDKQVKAAKPLEIVGGRRHDPVSNRLVGHIHKAYRQFMAVSPDRKFPDVLAFLNSDRQCDKDPQGRALLCRRSAILIGSRPSGK
jgi:hypothetical protein